MSLPLADISVWLAAAPLAFLVGLVVGLVLCSRGYRITRTSPSPNAPGGARMATTEDPRPQPQPDQPEPPPTADPQPPEDPTPEEQPQPPEAPEEGTRQPGQAGSRRREQ